MQWSTGRTAEALISTVAGQLPGVKGPATSRDGIGGQARFATPSGLCRSGDGDSLLITEFTSCRIRMFFPACDEFAKHKLRVMVTAALYGSADDTSTGNSAALPVPPLISVIVDYAAPDSKSPLFSHSCPF